jgi:hypothetical protein
MARDVRLVVDDREAEFDPPSGSLGRYRGLDRTMVMLERHTGLVADLARREVARIRAITEEANQLEREIGPWSAVSLPRCCSSPDAVR